MLNRVESYQSFVPKLKPKSLISKSSTKLHFLDKGEIINHLTKKKQSSVINSTRTLNSASHINTSCIPLSSSSSARVLAPNPLRLSRLSKIKTAATKLIISKVGKRHTRNMTNLETNDCASSNFKPLLIDSNEYTKQGALTDRLIRRRIKIKKTLKVIEDKKLNSRSKKTNLGFTNPLIASTILDKIEANNILSVNNRKAIMLDKLIECNDSIGSSLSSTFQEIIPRYK